MPTLLAELAEAHARRATELSVDEVASELERIDKSKKLSSAAKIKARQNVRERVLYAIQETGLNVAGGAEEQHPTLHSQIPARVIQR